MSGIDYSTVRVGREKLGEKIQKDNDLKRLLPHFEAKPSKLNRLSENRYFGKFVGRKPFSLDA